MNLNDKVKRTQIAYFVIGALGLSAVLGGIWYYTGDEKKSASAPKPTPQLTGVVAQSLTDEVQRSALKSQQDTTNDLAGKLDELINKVNQQNINLTTQNKRIEEQTNKNRELESKLDILQRQGGVAPQNTATLPTTDANGTPLPNQLAGKNVPTATAPNSYYNLNNIPGANLIGTGLAPGGVAAPAPIHRELNHHEYEKKITKKKSDLPYIPSGSFSEALMIEGADANASVTGQQNTSPVEFRLRGKLIMPNDEVYDMSGCFVTGEIWGDISSERGEVRTRKLSCKWKNKGTIDMDLPGHVAYQGKQGIRGRPIMRNGKIIAYAGAAGVISGVGAGINSASTPVVGIGGSTSVSAGDIARQGIGGGAQKTGDTLSDYWIKRAEQYHPVIEIGAGNVVTVVFQDGFQMKTIEEILEEKAAKEQANETRTPQPQPVAATSSNGSSAIPNPDEIVKQARQLQLGQSIQ